MKTSKFLTLFFLLFAVYATTNAQSTADPDSVCAGSTESYKVTGTLGSTYQWFVSGGAQASGGTTDSITVTWSATPGLDTLKVIEYNTIGCPGDTIKLAVRILPLPTVALS